MSDDGLTSDDGPTSDETPAMTPPRRRRGLALPIVGTLLLALALAGGWLAFRAYQVQHELTAARAEVDASEQSLRNSQWSELRASAVRLAEHSDAARYAASDPLWSLAARLPVVGDDMRAVTTVADALDHVAQVAVMPISRSRTLTAADAPDHDVASLLQGLAADQQLIEDAARAVATSRAAVAAIDLRHLLGPVRDGVSEAKDGLAKLDSITADGAVAAGAVPALLGTPQPTTLLLVFQNPGESRGTGGLVGAWGEVQARNGSLSLAKFGPNDDLPVLTQLPSDVNPEITKAFETDVLLSLNANLSANYPDAAKLLSAMWSAGPGNGRVPDAVISLDPVALGSLLEVTGPITTSDGTVVNADNAADLLLRQVYERFATNFDARIAFLGDVTRAVFDKLSTGTGSPTELGRRLITAADEGRAMLWSRDDAQQQAWRTLGVSGELGKPELGRLHLALNSAEASKLQAWLSTTVLRTCSAAGQTVTATLTSSVPETIPEYMQSHVPGLDPRRMRLIVSWYVPGTQPVAAVRVGGAVVPFAEDHELGWKLLRVTVEVAPGEQVTVGLDLPGSPAESQINVAAQVDPVPVQTDASCR